MRIFFLFCFILSSIFSFSQPVINRTFGTNTVNDPRLSATLNLLIPRYTDTSQANSGTNIGLDSCAALIFTYSDNSYWLRACNPKRWIKILKTGDATNTTANNGLTKTGDNIQLGGDLIKDTEISGTNLFGFTISNLTGFNTIIGTGAASATWSQILGNTASLTLRTHQNVSGVDQFITLGQSNGQVSLSSQGINANTDISLTLDTVNRFSIIGFLNGSVSTTDSVLVRDATTGQILLKPQSGIAAAVSWQSTLAVNNVATTTAIYDSLRGKRIQSDSFYTFLQAYTADTIYFYGDSYTTGSNASPTSYRYSTQLAAWLRLVEKNLGVSGSTLMKRVPIDPYGQVNLIDRLNTIPIYTGTLQRYIVIAYGFNDMGVNNANYTPPNFRIDYQQVMDTIIARGWPRHRIIIVAPWYASTATYSAYATTTGTPANDRARHLVFIDTARATATANGAVFVDAFTAELVNDSSQLFSGDNIHPGNYGHQIIAQAIYTTLIDTIRKNNWNLAINGRTAIQNLYLPDMDTASRDAPLLAYASDGKVVMMASQRVLKDQSLLSSQPGNLNIVGKGLFGNVTATDALEEETVMSPGGAKFRWGRFNGTLPTMTSDSALEMGMISSTVTYLGGYNRRTNTALNLTINGLGASVAIGTVSFAGSNRLQVSGNASATKFFGGGTTTPTAAFHAVASTGGAGTAPFKVTSGPLLVTPEVGAFGEFLTDKFYATITTGTARKEITLNDIALTADRIPFATTNGRLTDNANFRFASSELIVGSASDAGAFSLQNTGGFFQSGAVTINLGSDATGDMYYRNGSGSFVRLPVGTSGQFIGVSAGIPTWTTIPTLDQSTHTPTLTNTTNISASVASVVSYTRVGNVIHGAGMVQIDAIAAATVTELGISLPVASDFANEFELAGTAVATYNGGNESGNIRADITNDRALLRFYSTSTDNQAWYFTFTYRVLGAP